MTAKQSIFTVLAVILLLFSIPAPAAPPANLRSNVVIDADTIRLGDIFDGKFANAEKVIAYAPAPGRKLILEATWLFRVARAYRVRWRPSSRLDRTIVERRSHVIETEQIVETILDALQEQARIEGEMELELDERAKRIFLPTDITPVTTVRSLSYQQRSGRFSAILTAGERNFTVAGSAHRLVLVPTLAQRIYAGDIIRLRDIDWKSMRLSRLDSRTVLNETKLVGMSPRRPIVAGRAIMTAEIQPPTLVKRGKRVTIYLKTKIMQLTAKGKSLENGGKGDVVRVQNIDSGKTIEAQVIGPERVAVFATSPIALN
jgi:flagella basal body P-ring formation protein FlgA